MADNDSRAGTRYADAAITAFVDRIHAREDAALADTFASPEREGMPSIQLAKAEAKFLELVTFMQGARRVVEVGTLAGYSAMRLARGLSPGGHLWTLENEPRHAEVARANLARAGLLDRVSIVLGDAVESLSTLESEGPFDLVFIDADKERYPVYGEWARRNLRPGGLLIADNVYFFGQLLGDSSGAQAMRAFHEAVAAHFDTCCIPTPDGMLLGRRKD